MKIGILALQGDVREHEKCLMEAAATLGMKAGLPGEKAGNSKEKPGGKGIAIDIIHARTEADLAGLGGIILPGGESTTMWKLLVRHGMVEKLKKVPCVFGTCAGLILMSSHAEGKIEGQGTLGLLDCPVLRNAYGSQIESFEAEIEISLGNWKAKHAGSGIEGIGGFHGTETGTGNACNESFHGKASVAFIRAPIIKSTGSAVPIAWHESKPQTGRNTGLQANGKDIVGVEEESAVHYYLGLACHPEIEGETFFHRRFLEKCAGISMKRKR